MEVIDDHGRLFGLVNVVDAVAVLLVLSVLVAGVALVFGGQSSDRAVSVSRHVTLDLGPQPNYVVSALNEGDTYSPSSNANLTVTDVYLAPQGSNTRVLLRVRLQGVATGDSFNYQGAPPRLGRDLSIQTDTYQVSGTIRDIGDRSDLVATETTVVLRALATPENADRLRPGRDVRIANRSVATIDGIEIYETNSSERRLAYIQATLQTYIDGETTRFGGTQIVPTASIRLPLDGRSVTGTILAIDTDLTTRNTDVLVTDTVSASEVEDIDAGDAYRIDGREVATVESVSIYGTDDAARKRIAVGLRLRTLDHANNPLFGGIVVRTGERIPFRTDSYELTGTIQRVGTTQQRGTPTTRTVTLQVREIPPAIAEGLRSGMTESAGGDTVARIVEVEREPSTVVITSNDGNIFLRDHPVNNDLTLTAELSVRETTDGLTFKRRPLQQGDTVVLDLGSVTIRATVIGI